MTNLLLLWAAAAVAAEGDWAWNQTDHSLALTRGQQVVWQFNYNRRTRASPTSIR